MLVSSYSTFRMAAGRASAMSVPSRVEGCLRPKTGGRFPGLPVGVVRIKIAARKDQQVRTIRSKGENNED